MNNMCYYTTTTRTPACRYHHPCPHPSQLRPYRPTQSGQHFPLFSRRKDTRKHLRQLHERVGGPAHTANEHQCTRVTPPPTTPQHRVRPPTQHYPLPAPRVTSQTACRHLRERVVVHHLPAHTFRSHSGSAPVKQDNRDRQTGKRDRRGKHRKVLGQGAWFGPPLHTQHAPSTADHAVGPVQSGQEMLGGGGGRRNPPCAGVQLHSMAAAPRRTCDKATKPRFGRTSPTFLRGGVGRTIGAHGSGPIGVRPPRGKLRDWAQRSIKVPRRCHSSRAWVPERADGEQDHGEYGQK
jgi:hypothetical protein